MAEMKKTAGKADALAKRGSEYDETDTMSYSFWSVNAGQIAGTRLRFCKPTIQNCFEI